jgi:hypothetical protein
MRIRGVIGLLTLSLALGCGESAEEAPPPDAGTRIAMGDVAGALRTVLPLTLSAERFADPANREVIDRQLATFAESGAMLAEHVQDRDAGFAFLGRRFAADTREIAWRFQAGQTEEARFLLGNVVRDCVARHARLPSGPSSALGRRLYEGVDTAALAPEALVALQVATRQFDEALETCEALFGAPHLSATELDLSGIVATYLLVAVRVREDPARAQRGLATLAARTDVPRYLAAYLQSWQVALGTLARRDPAPDPVTEARVLLGEARRASRYPADRRALVHGIAASGVLHRLASEQPEPSPALAEAYYLLGLAEPIIRGPGLSESDFYLETSIRMAPGAPFAPDAYAVLEEQVLRDYEGSAGSPVPPEARQRLDTLRDLVDAAGGRRRPPGGGPE